MSAKLSGSDGVQMFLKAVCRSRISLSFFHFRFSVNIV